MAPFDLPTPKTLPRTKHEQWRRQTIKSGSAFEGQLDSQVGQMHGWTEGLERSMEDAKRRWGEVWGRSSSPIAGLGAMPPEKFSKINYEIAYFLHFCKLKWSHLQCRQGFQLGTATYIGLDRYGYC